MSWIMLTPVNGPKTIFNTDNIAFISEAPKEKAAQGVGAGLSMIDNTNEVIQVSESLEIIQEKIRADQRWTVTL